MFFVRRNNHHDKIHSFACGDLTELLDPSHDISIVLGENMKQTKGHYHSRNDEVYLCLSGEILIQLYDPDSKAKEEIKLKELDYLFIGKNVHHKVLSTSVDNKLLAISIPGWKKEFEFESRIIP